MGKDMRFSAWLFLASLIGIYATVPLGNLFITLPTGISAADIAAHYKANSTGILLYSILEPGLGALLWMFYIPPVAVAMMRMRNASMFLVICHVIGGTMAVIAPFTAGIFFGAAALRPDLPPEVILVLHDIGKMFFLTSLPMLVACFSVAMAIHRDDPVNPILPKWLVPINIAYGLGCQVNLIAPFVKSGPFALDGVIGMWLPLILVAIHIVATGYAILRVPDQRWEAVR